MIKQLYHYLLLVFVNSRAGLPLGVKMARPSSYLDLEKKNTAAAVCCHVMVVLPSGAPVSFSSRQRNLIKTFQIEDIMALITKMNLIFS